MRQRGTIAVHKGSPNQTKRLLEDFAREIDQGHSILAFPEGHRTRDGRVRPFKRGVFHIARELDIPTSSPPRSPACST